MTATLLLVIIALIGLLLWSEWRFGQLRDTAEQLGDIVRNGHFNDRVRAHAGTPAVLADDANRLLAQIGIQELIIRERDRALGGVLTSLNEPVAIHREGIEFANERFVTLLTSHADTPIIGRSLADLVAPDYAEILREYLRRSLVGELGCEELQVELRGKTASLPVQIMQARIDYRGGPALLLTIAPVAVPAPAVIERRMPSTHETLECISEAVLTTDSGGAIDYMNSAAQQILGVTANEAYGRSVRQFLNLIDELDGKPLEDPVRQCLAAQAQITVGRGALLVTAMETTKPRAVELTVSPLIHRGIMVGAVVVWRDVSEVRGITQQMTYQATHDPLTGLVNRREFERRVQEALSRAATSTVGDVLCFLDLDRFKAVNDSCGHEAGDNMLREVATLLRTCVRDSDTVGRLGGDEFGLLLTGCSLERALEITDELLQRLRDFRFVWTDKIFDIGVSIGAIEITGQDVTLEELMSAADGACYVAKKRGNHVHVHTARDERRLGRNEEDHWLPRLKSALAHDRFELLLQPIMPVSAATTLKGGPALEVLLRMQDDRVPEGISPLEFQRAAERHKLMSDIDCWVVKNTINALADGEILLPRHRSLAINISGQTLGNPLFLEFVVDCFDRTGVRPEQVCFEVTENSVITNIEHSRRFINVLHGLGVHFALDDFGRGLSSFGNLKNLELNYLKIDGSFIRNLAADSVNQAFVTAMLDLARTLNFKVVAEHVEDQRVLDAVRRMGVDYVQGFQVGRPRPLVRATANEGWMLNKVRLQR